VYRWLPRNHRFRRDPAFGTARGTNPPPARNHATAVEQGQATDKWKGTLKGDPRHETGINTSCPLSFLHLFDVIWDICPDMMHIVKNFFEKLTWSVFSGNRIPAWSEAKHPRPSKDGADYEAKLAKYKDAVARWKLAVKQNLKCIFPVADQELVDRRMKNLVGPANWVKNSMVCSLWTFHVYTLHTCTGCIYDVHIFMICIHTCIHVLYMYTYMYT
jgi:hypothetical protein